MYIKQWLEEPLQVRTCQMVVDETIWELGIRPKTVEIEVQSAQTNALGQPMRSYIRLYDGIYFYQRLLDYFFEDDLELQMQKCLPRLNATILGTKTERNLFNRLGRYGKTVAGLNHTLGTQILGIQQKLVRKHYATV